MRARTERDLARFKRRQRDGSFFRAIAVIGGVGWPIALLSIGGALLGRMLDRALFSGIRLTVVLLVLGAGLGTWSAFSLLSGRR